MNVLINADEWLVPWAREIVTAEVKKQITGIRWHHTYKYVKECQQEFRKSGLIVIDFTHVNYLLKKDFGVFRNTVNETYKSLSKQSKIAILEQLSDRNIGDQQIVDRYLADKTKNFAKAIAPQLTTNPHWILDSAQANWSQPFFIRNINNNEDLVRRCIDTNAEFWFVDTGYTNFLHNKQKVWHRLVKNHIHHGPRHTFFPTDRIANFPSLPAKWRRKGSKILVIESSPSHYAMRGTSLEQWRSTIVDGIRAVSDREIEFRPKDLDRKTRTPVFDLLKETKEYYCVVSDSSAAAVESIWAGTPVVTLNRHITNSVSRNSLADINDLYREDIEPWLAMLSYSQFTFEELCNGTAVSIVKEWFNV